MRFVQSISFASPEREIGWRTSFYPCCLCWFFLIPCFLVWKSFLMRLCVVHGKVEILIVVMWKGNDVSLVVFCGMPSFSPTARTECWPWVCLVFSRLLEWTCTLKSFLKLVLLFLHSDQMGWRRTMSCCNGTRNTHTLDSLRPQSSVLPPQCAQWEKRSPPTSCLRAAAQVRLGWRVFEGRDFAF